VEQDGLYNGLIFPSKTRMTDELIDKVKAGTSPAAQYIGKYEHLRGPYNYLWMNSQRRPGLIRP